MLRNIAICGFPRSGSTLLYMAMANAGATQDGLPVRFSPAEVSALHKENRVGDLVVTKRPKDIFAIDKILSTLGRRRRQRFILLTVRDPRSVLVSRHASYDRQPFIGHDYSLNVTPDYESFADPGLSDYADAVREALSRTDLSCRMIRYEKLVTTPGSCQRAIARWTGLSFAHKFASFHQRPIPDGLTMPLNGIRPIDAARRNSWADPVHAARLVRQFRLAPGLFDHLEALGYETDRQWFDTLAQSAPEGLDDRCGTIVAYYTDDPVYRREARRLEASAKRLGLPIVMTEMPSGQDWLTVVRRKAAFLADQRRNLAGPLLYVDVDAILHRDPWPYLRGIGEDVGVAVLRDGKMRGGTIYLADTPGAHIFLKDWQQRMDADPLAWDQWPLDDIQRDIRGGAALGYTLNLLPPSLCGIFDFYRKRRESHEDKPVYIEHLQASRENRADEVNDSVQQALCRRRARVAEIESDLFGNDMV
ncbi:hypothetical protein ASE75_00975 [Sphingomonas sp. Leaf17]|uniref:putative nucleotide-diphospho-sugar transferase n=1 Tax=Sphingomonas sp. Leaf17 TaxID=1735683 RepID=UPI0006FC991C|nr:putative nucleotide-diphospho-sugar transferase [Sphingomonas sp. Leaf17]KQM67551.1 hypothetical protein ASE75_00975 [Sphingomonas sp. Leaf17]